MERDGEGWRGMEEGWKGCGETLLVREQLCSAFPATELAFPFCNNHNQSSITNRKKN